MRSLVSLEQISQLLWKHGGGRLEAKSGSEDEASDSTMTCERNPSKRWPWRHLGGIDANCDCHKRGRHRHRRRRRRGGHNYARSGARHCFRRAVGAFSRPRAARNPLDPLRALPLFVGVECVLRLADKIENAAVLRLNIPISKCCD